MRINRFLFCSFLATFIWITGCATPKSVNDPLAGFHVAALYTPGSNKVITSDSQEYIQTLSPEERKSAGPIEYFEDGTGQHAVMIIIGLNGTVWRHVLIYDKDNKRTKTIKYASGNYRS